MTKKSVSRFLGILLTPALIMSVCGWLPFTAPVTIHSVPEGASVYQAGSNELLGTTPYATSVSFSKKQFDVKMDKFHDAQITIDSGSMENVWVTLETLPAVVYSEPPSAVYEADAMEPIGKTPLEIDVQLESRTCVAKAEDYYDQKITIGLDTPRPLKVELKRRPFVTLTTAPDGVGIYENGQLLATSSMKEEILKPRSFELKKEGYYSQTINLTSSSDPEMSVMLKELPTVTVQTVPAGAEIYVDGKSVGTGSVSMKIAEATDFEAKADRYYAKTVSVEPKTQTVSIELKAMPYVMIKSAPSGASVSIDGKAAGATPLEQLIEKAVSVELTLDGYVPQTVTLDGSDLSPTITLEKEPPTVTISSTPPGATVTLDGSSIGITPVDRKVKDPITVEVSLDGYHSQTVTLDGTDLKPMVTLVKKTWWEKLTGK